MKFGNIEIDMNEIFDSMSSGYVSGDFYDKDSFSKMISEYINKKRIEKRKETIGKILDSER